LSRKHQAEKQSYLTDFQTLMLNFHPLTRSPLQMSAQRWKIFVPFRNNEEFRLNFPVNVQDWAVGPDAGLVLL
jgi:hypothetical protein